MLLRLGFATILTLFCMSGFASPSDQIYKTYVKKDQIKIMSYNVQNLFDSKHDAGKNDYEFLPKSSPEKANCPNGNYYKKCIETSWTQRKIYWKLDQLVTALEAQGDFPDILVLSEVENQNVIKMAVSKLGYDGFKMTESPDNRGIDLAVLYKKDRLRFLEFEEVVVDKLPFNTRNASAVHFEILVGRTKKKEVIGIYPAHWPSQGGGKSNPELRITAGMKMRQLIDKYSKKYSNENYYAVALGDFNTLESEVPHPIEAVFYDQSWKNRMYSVEELARNQKSKFVPYMPPGTYFYHPMQSWSKFDYIFVSASLTDGQGVDVDAHSFRIHNPELVSVRNDAGEKIPYRYNHNAENKQWLGFSDHYAVHAIINLN